MQKNHSVVVAIPKDTEEILRLYQEHCEFEERYTDVFRIDWSFSEKSRKQLAKRFKDKKFRMYIAKSKNQTVGYAICEIADSPSRILDKLLIIHTFFVTAEYRRQGIGSILMETILNWAKEAEVKRIRVETLSNNAEAVAFYEKHGLSVFSTGLEAYI